MCNGLPSTFSPQLGLNYCIYSIFKTIINNFSFNMKSFNEIDKPSTNIK